MKQLLLSMLVLPLVCAAQQPPLEAKVAMLDAQRQLKSDAPEVKRAAKAIRAATARCRDGGGKLVDQAVIVQQRLTESGLVVGIVEVLEAVDAVLVDSRDKADCVKVLSHYAVLRDSGTQHALAVVQLRSLNREFNSAAK